MKTTFTTFKNLLSNPTTNTNTLDKLAIHFMLNGDNYQSNFTAHHYLDMLETLISINAPETEINSIIKTLTLGGFSHLITHITGEII